MEKEYNSLNYGETNNLSFIKDINSKLKKELNKKSSEIQNIHYKYSKEIKNLISIIDTFEIEKSSNQKIIEDLNKSTKTIKNRLVSIVNEKEDLINTLLKKDQTIKKFQKTLTFHSKKLSLKEDQTENLNFLLKNEKKKFDSLKKELKFKIKKSKTFDTTHLTIFQDKKASLLISLKKNEENEKKNDFEKMKNNFKIGIDKKNNSYSNELGSKKFEFDLEPLKVSENDFKPYFNFNSLISSNKSGNMEFLINEESLTEMRNNSIIFFKNKNNESNNSIVSKNSKIKEDKSLEGKKKEMVKKNSFEIKGLKIKKIFTKNSIEFAIKKESNENSLIFRDIKNLKFFSKNEFKKCKNQKRITSNNFQNTDIKYKKKNKIEKENSIIIEKFQNPKNKRVRRKIKINCVFDITKIIIYSSAEYVIFIKDFIFCDI